MRSKKTNMPLKSYEWSSIDLLKDLSRKDIICTEEFKNYRESFFWHDMGSEYDSINFLYYLMRNESLNLSNDFLEFVSIWYLDEQNHYRGMRKIVSTIYNVDEDEVDNIVKSKSSDFNEISSFLCDEFTILLSIAFDEITSTRAYKQDFKIYDKFGSESMSKWVRLAARDEAAHYANAMMLLNKHHSHRFGEAPGILNKIVKMEISDGFEYNNTFIFDHDTVEFTDDLIASSRDSMLKALLGREQAA